MSSSVSGLLSAEASTLTQAQAAQPQAPANPPEQATEPVATPQDTVELSTAAQAAQSNAPPVAPNPPPTTAEIVLLHLQGQTVQQIATHFSLSVQDVLSYLGNTAQT